MNPHSGMRLLVSKPIFGGGGVEIKFLFLITDELVEILPRFCSDSAAMNVNKI